MGLGKHKPRLEELARAYAEAELKGTRNRYFIEALDHINSAVGGNKYARGYLLDYFTQRVHEYKTGERK